MSYSAINVSFISAAYNLCSYSSASDKTAEIRGLLKASAYGYVNLADTVNYLAGGGFVAVIYIGTEISYKAAALNLCRKVFYVNFAFNGNVFYCSLCRKAKKTDVFCANGYGHIFYRMILTVKVSYISVGNISDRRPFLIVEVNIRSKNGVCRCGCSIVYLCGDPRKLLCGANLVNAVHLCRLGNGGAVPAFAAAGFGACYLNDNRLLTVAIIGFAEKTLYIGGRKSKAVIEADIHVFICIQLFNHGEEALVLYPKACISIS